MSSQSISETYPIYHDIDGQPLESGYIYVGTAGLQADTNQITVYWDADLTIPATQPIRTTGGYLMNSGTPGKIYTSADDYSMLVNNKNNSQVTSNLNAASGSLISSGYTGSVSRSVSSKVYESVSVKDFGAVGDGTTDDTAAIQAAIDSGYFEITVPQGTYKVTSTLTISGKFGFSIIGFDGADKTEFQWSGAVGGVMVDVTGCRQLCIRGLLLRGSNISSPIAATCLRITSGSGNTNTLHYYEKCAFDRVSGRAIDLQGNNWQLDMIYFLRCNISDCDIGCGIEGASTFMIYFDGGTLGDFDTYGFTGITGGNLFVQNMGFIQGGTPGTPLVGTPYIFHRTNTFNDITVKNCQHEGQSLYLKADDDSGSANKSPITLINCTVGPTASGTYNVIDYQQRGPFIWEGGNIGSSFGTYTAAFAKPGSAGDGGSIFYNNVNNDGTIGVSAGTNTYLNGFAASGEFRVGNGIVFPATAVDSVNVNVLDDYEEGTFTPVIYGSTAAGTGTYTQQTGTYVKIGKIITLTMSLAWTAHTGTGTMRVSGLPFNYSAGNGILTFVSGLTYTGTSLQALNIGNELYIGQYSSGVGDTYVPMDSAATLGITVTGTL